MTGSPVWHGPPPEEMPAWSIVQAGHLVGRRFWSAFAAVGLTPIQFGVLLELDRHPELTNAELARAVLVTPQSMSEVLAALQSKDLISRTGPSRRGKRTPVQLTKAGCDRLRQCETVVEHVRASLGLNGPQMRTLNTLLHTVLKTDHPHPTTRND